MFQEDLTSGNSGTINLSQATARSDLFLGNWKTAQPNYMSIVFSDADYECMRISCSIGNHLRGTLYERGFTRPTIWANRFRGDCRTLSLVERMNQEDKSEAPGIECWTREKRIRHRPNMFVCVFVFQLWAANVSNLTMFVKCQSSSIQIPKSAWRNKCPLFASHVASF